MANPNEIEEIEGEEMTVTLELDDGRTVECAIITIFDVGKESYIALMPLDENGGNEDGTFWFYGYREDEADPNKEPQLRSIVDDDELERVEDAFDEYLDECEFDEIVSEEENGDEA